MATQKQIEANRLNAAKSTGPRSPEGKSATRFNALKHGIFAEAPILIGEDAAAFQTLRDSYLDRFQPAAPEEETLLSSIIGHAWFLARFTKIESHIWNYRLGDSPDHTPYYYARAHTLVFEQLNSLQRRLNATERHFRRDLDLLIKLQAARKKAAPPPEPNPQPEPAETVAPEIGFVPPISPEPRNLPGLPLAPSRPSSTTLLSNTLLPDTQSEPGSRPLARPE